MDGVMRIVLFKNVDCRSSDFDFGTLILKQKQQTGPCLSFYLYNLVDLESYKFHCSF